eukprot:CAMPEP_0195522170 /NCGR_PEP_ID=MMETSP0794_2-20130614/20079_1 /TAXON_ID=515487 /ORGANISM="Stephanopyxis turris, Strain CCMP 815" /LENGTH=254 /DNA_ID=CAMNT_0040651861 /DNA_START=140 /DNA_END=904 /DNA_ORIENTATION=-
MSSRMLKPLIRNARAANGVYGIQHIKTILPGMQVDKANANTVPLSTPLSFGAEIGSGIQCRQFSSNENTGFFGRMKGKLQERVEKNKADKGKEQLEKMSNYAVWNLNAFAAELDHSLGGWANKIPGVGQLKDIKALRESRKVLDAAISVLGEDAVANDMKNIGKKEKLQICIKGEATMEELNQVITQFESMEMMHRVLRYRKAKGVPLPTDEAAMRTAVQEDAQKLITKTEKKVMTANYMKNQRHLKNRSRARR